MASSNTPSALSKTRSGEDPTFGTPKTASATKKAQPASKEANMASASTAQPPMDPIVAVAADVGSNAIPPTDAPPGRTMRPRKPPPPAAPKRVRRAPRPRAPPPPPVIQPAMIRNTITGGWMINPRHQDSVVNFHRRHPQMAKPLNDLANEVKRRDAGIFEGEDHEGEGYDGDETEDEDEGVGDRAELGGVEMGEGEVDEGEVNQGEIDVAMDDTHQDIEDLTDGSARKKYANVFESDESDPPATPTQPPRDRKAWLQEQQDKWANE